MTKPNPAGTKIAQRFFRAKFGRKAKTLRQLLQWRNNLVGEWLRGKPPVRRV